MAYDSRVGSLCFEVGVFFVFEQKTAYEMRMSDWSSDVWSSDLCPLRSPGLPARPGAAAVSGRLRPSRFVAQPIAYPDTPSGIVADLIAKRTDRKRDV